MHERPEGAVTRVSDLVASDGAAYDDIAFKVASDIQVDQRTEIRRMKRMLEEIAGRPEGPSPQDRHPSP